MAELWTVRKVIAWIASDLTKRGIDSARLDADLLVCHALKLRRIAIYLDLDRPLVDEELREIRKLVERRRAREPMAYILGEREFYGRPFEVTRDVLIPRPDTETVIEQALLCLKGSPLEGPLLDLCTGSGAISVTLAAELPARTVVATDISEAALTVARRNAEKNAVTERLELRHGDLFGALQDEERFALIASNPPYIGSVEMATLEADVRDYEPHIALDAGQDALLFYRRITAHAKQYLLPGAWLLVEVGYTQANDVRALFEAAGFADVRSAKDLSGTERVVMGRYVVDAS